MNPLEPDGGQSSPKAKRVRKPNSRLDVYTTTAALSQPRTQNRGDVKLGRPSGDQLPRKKQGKTKLGVTTLELEARHSSVEPDAAPEDVSADDVDDEFFMHHR